MDDLKRPTVKQLYDDLRKFNPKPVASRESELPGEMPSFAPDGLPGNPPAGGDAGVGQSLIAPDHLPGNPPAGGKDIKFEDLGGKGKEKQESKESQKPKEKGKEKPKK